MGVRVPTRAVHGGGVWEESSSNNSLWWALWGQEREVKRPEAVHPHSSKQTANRWSISMPRAGVFPGFGASVVVYGG